MSREATIITAEQGGGEAVKGVSEIAEQAAKRRRALSRFKRVGGVVLSVLGGITAGVAVNRVGTGIESVPAEIAETANIGQENPQLEKMEFGKNYEIGMTRGGLVVLGDHRSLVAFLDYQSLQENEGRIDFANGSVQVVFELENERSTPAFWYFTDEHNETSDNQRFLVFPTLAPDIRSSWVRHSSR